MSEQGQLKRKKKVKSGKSLDYDRLCAALGRTWSYITPVYFYEEMDLFDISKLVPYLGKNEYESCWRGMDNSNLGSAEQDGVIRIRREADV